MLELSIVMPCLNEAETIKVCISKAQTFLKKSGILGEIIIGDNGSIDGSQDIARSCGARVVDVSVRGYGAALYGAIMEARGMYCIMGDADDSYDFLNLDQFVKELRNGADLVMGNRFLGGIMPGAMPWKNRYIGNPILTGIGRLMFKCPSNDFHCGLRGFKRQSFLKMDLRTTGMEFASEMVIKSTLAGMKVVEVPTTLSKDGRSRPPHLRPYRDGWRHLRFMLLFCPNWLFLYPGILLILLGLVSGAALLSGPVEIFGFRFSTDTLIFSTTIVAIGFQSILFMILSHAFAVQEGLLPRPFGLSFSERIFTLERGILFGGSLVFLGVVLACYAINIWSRVGFGEINIEDIGRYVIISSAFLTLGSETILSSFLLSIIQLNLKPYSGDVSTDNN